MNPNFKCEKCGITGWLPAHHLEEIYRCQRCGTLIRFELPQDVIYRGVQIHDPYCSPCDCPACLAATPANKDKP